MKKAKKHYWRLWRQQGMPFALRALLVRHAIKGTPAPLVAKYLRSRGVPATTGGWGWCHKCGVHLTWLAIRWRGWRVSFPVGCCGVYWSTPRVRRAAAARGGVR